MIFYKYSNINFFFGRNVKAVGETNVKLALQIILFETYPSDENLKGIVINFLKMLGIFFFNDSVIVCVSASVSLVLLSPEAKLLTKLFLNFCAFSNCASFKLYFNFN